MKPNLDLTKVIKKRRIYKFTAFSCIGLASCGIIVAIPVTIITLSNNATTNTPVVPIPPSPKLSFNTNINNISLSSTSTDTTILRVSVSVSNPIDGQNLSYQWFSSDTNNSNTTWTKIINATSSSYEVTNITTTKKYFKCEAYYPSAQPLTSNIIFVVKLEPTIPPPPPAPSLSFTTNINNVSLPSTSSNTTVLSVSVSINNPINGQNNPSYQWFSSDTNNPTGTWTEITGATNSSYEVTNITTTKKYFKCEVNYPSAQPLTSNIVYVEKLAPPLPPPPPPIVEIPSSVPNPDNGGEEIKSNENEAIVNEWYRHIVTRSASINFVNNSEFPHHPTAKGTAWILDYELPTNGTYPLKWYYSTNAHVANNLKNPNDYDPYKYSDPEGKNTIKVFFELATYKTGNSMDLLRDPLPLFRVNISSDFNREWLNTIPKTVFTGVDYLKSHPSKWNPKWVNEEIIDVAIVEIIFNNEEQARKVTYNYADLPEDKKIKFATISLMTNYNTNILSNEFYVAGFPDIGGKPTFMQNTIKQYPMNSDPYNIVNQGSPLAKFPYASTFQNKPGVIDNIIGLTLINVTYHGVEHKLSGIAYSFRHSSLPGGSSGSMALNKNYEVLGNHFAGWNNSDVGLTISYLSEGGTSPLNPRFYSEPYNLIFGGYENQKNSYKQAMQKIYGPKPNTHLFSRMTK